MRRRIAAALCAASLVWSPAACAEEPPTANKLIVLVPAQGCDFATLEPRLAKAGKAMVRNRRTTRVIVDWPADPSRNLDLMGIASPFIAALEVSAELAVLGRLAAKLRRKLEKACPVDLYLVEERRLMTTPRSWKLGEASSRIKVLTTVNRKQGLLRAEFLREWVGTHAELSLGWRRARGGDGHYVQNIVTQSLGGGTPELDGIGEIEGQATGSVSDEERQARIQSAAHAPSFLDMEQNSMFRAREVILKD